MLELIREVFVAIFNYGVEDVDLLNVIFSVFGLIPLSVYCLKFNCPSSSRLTCMAVQIIRLSLFSLCFYTYIRYGFRNSFIQYNSLALIIYTIIGYYYWVNKELLYEFKSNVRKFLKYIFFVSTTIEIVYLASKIFLYI